MSLYKFSSGLCAVVLIALTAFAMPVRAETPEYTIVIRNHMFEPARVTIPADTKVKLIIRNEDPTPEEFESYDFNREKIVGGNNQVTIFVGPLSVGEYAFFGEFHMDTAQGVLVVE